MGGLTDIRWQTVGPASITTDRAESSILHDALAANAEFEQFLREAMKAQEPILLVVNDGHRATKTRDALVALAKRVGREPKAPRFGALVATGTHRFETEERNRFERETFAGCGLHIADTAWHDASDPDNLRDIGGVYMHRRLTQSRFLLPIGSVEPHYFAGLTGPHKTVTIGCMAYADIERNHAGALDAASSILRLNGNPVFDNIARVLDTLRSHGKDICAIAQVIRGNVLCAAEVGDPLDALDRLLPTVRQIYVRQVPDPVDLLHLKVPPPLDRNLYQADKAVKNNHQAVRDGGGILLEADCTDGIGPDAFMNLLRRADTYAAATRIVANEGYRLGDHKAVMLRRLTDPAQRGVCVALVSNNVTDQEAKTAGMKAFRDARSAVEWLTTVVDPPPKRGLIVEDAGVVTVVTGR